LEVSVVTNILGEDASFLLYHFSLFQAHCMDRTRLTTGPVPEDTSLGWFRGLVLLREIYRSEIVAPAFVAPVVEADKKQFCQ
jgi:hypothetical protein